MRLQAWVGPSVGLLTFLDKTNLWPAFEPEKHLNEHTAGTLNLLHAETVMFILHLLFMSY